MPVYAYRAVDKKGKGVSGEITAETLRTARGHLREMGLFPTELKEGGHTARVKRGRSRNLSLQALSVFCRQMGTLVAAGFPVSRALESLASASSRERETHLFTALDEEVRSGQSLSAAMERSGSFPVTAVEMVRSGEASGALGTVLVQISELAEKQITSRRQIWSAMAYPIFLVVVGLGIFVFLLAYVVPSVSKVFVDTGASLPLATKILIAVSNFVSSWAGAATGIVIVIGAVFAWRYFKTEDGRRVMERFFLRVPVVGDLFRKTTVARFCRVFSSLLAGGVEILEALEIARRASGSVLAADAVARARSRVAEGEALSRTLSGSRFFPRLVVEMFAVGEESGQLPRMSGEIALAWERETELTIQAMMSLIEPVMILVMGFLVGSVVIAVLLPIIQINQLVTQ